MNVINILTVLTILLLTILLLHSTSKTFFFPIYFNVINVDTDKSGDIDAVEFVSTSLAVCQSAATNLGLGRVEVGNSEGWSHLPHGCSMWSPVVIPVVHYNYNLASTRSCDYQKRKRACIAYMESTVVIVIVIFISWFLFECVV